MRALPKPAGDLAVVGLIGGVSLLVGVTLNLLRPHPLPWRWEIAENRWMVEVEAMQIAPVRSEGSTSAPDSNWISEPDLEAFWEFVNSKQGIVVDARQEPFYRMSHVPGAYHLSRQDLTEKYPVFLKHIASDTQVPIMIYCSGTDCEESRLMQMALIRLGHHRVGIFKGGWTAWRDAGYPTESCQ